MSEQQFSHRPVLYNEVIDGLRVKPDGIYVDGTFGRGGHASAILAMLNENGRLILMDKDPQAIEWAKSSLSDDSRVTIIHDDYAQLQLHIETMGLQQMVDGVLLDLGVSSPQLDDRERGFSFQAIRFQENLSVVDLGPLINWRDQKLGLDIWDLLEKHDWGVV